MSKASGTRFKAFHERVSEAAGLDVQKGERLPFAPDFLDNLAVRIATGDLEEAAMDWAIYRAPGNQSQRAILLYGREGQPPVETRLGQTDFAWDAAWLAAGLRAEWLDAPRELFKEEAKRRGIEPIPRTLVCDAFTFNRNRGTIASDTGYDIVPVPSPRVADSTETRERKSERSPEYQAFCAKWNVAHSAESQEEAVARSTIKRINSLRLADYRKSEEYAATRRNGGPSLETLETLESGGKNGAPPAASSSSAIDTELQQPPPLPVSKDEMTTTIPSPPPAPDWDTVGRAAAQYVPVDDAWVNGTVRECQSHTPDITPQEITQLVYLKAKASRRADNPAGHLRRSVVNASHGHSFDLMRQRWRESQASVQAPKPRTREEQIEDLRLTMAFLDDSPNHVNAAELRAEIEAVRIRDPELYEEALGLKEKASNA